jgi:transcriptional/translational regulatory protein YebC/TACO1
VRYSKPEITMAASAAKTIQNPNPNPKLSFQIEDAGSTDVTKTHTLAAYAADE